METGKLFKGETAYMLDWLWASPIFNFLIVNTDIMVFILSLPLAIFFLVSPRMNSRLEIPQPRLAQALAAQKAANPLGIKKRLVYLLQKVDWLFREKLKLLPNAHTGRRVNFIFLLLAAWLVGMGTDWIVFSSKAGLAGVEARHADIALAPQMQAELWKNLFLISLYVILLALPFFLVEKNRGFYFDITALFFLWWISFDKYLSCWYRGCCFGVPWPRGVYNEILETTVFPVQTLESATGILLSIACILFMLYAKSYRPGHGCSFCLLSYAVPRFFWDYLRYHGEGYRPIETNGMFGLTMVQVICLVAIVLSIAWLFVLPLEKKLLDKL